MTSKRSAAAIGLALLAAGVAGGAGTGALWPASARAFTVLSGPDTTTPVAVPDSATRLPGRHLSAERVVAIAAALPAMRALLAAHRGASTGVYTKGAARWQVSFFARGTDDEIGQVLIADATGRVLEAWTGIQVAWTMARGYPGAFGVDVDSVWLWVPLSILFAVPFVDWRHPWRLAHLDLLVLSSFSLSLAFFNHADIDASTPLAYPPLAYLLVRMLTIARPRLRERTRGAPAQRREPGRQPAPVPAPAPAAPGPFLSVPPRWLVAGVIVLCAFRVTLNLLNGNVIDVGYAGVIGAHRIVHGEPLYGGGWPADNPHGDTYGPVAYEAYIPFVAVFGWSGRWDDLPAAHGAAVAFDLLALAGMFLLGLRVRGPTLGLALAWAWVSYPFTLFALESDTNDALVAALVIAALLACTTTGRRREPTARRMAARGALAALAGLTKFAPLALAPLLATDGLHDAPRRRRVRALATFAGAFVLCAAVVSVPALHASSLHTFIARTLVYQADRDSPFSVWGLYGGLSAVQAAVQVATVLGALALALLPRRRDATGLAAAAAAILIGVQLGIEHWFYLYLPWFFPPAMLALLAGGWRAAPDPFRADPDPAAAGESARSRQLAAA